MGDPKKHRKKYKTPVHPWNKQTIDEEKQISREFALKNKKEIWRAQSILRKFSNQAKRLIPLSTQQASKEKKQLLMKLERYGLLNTGSSLEDALALNVRDILNRRLQTVVHKNKLALSMKQARQFIVHQHIMVGNKLITSPAYLVPVAEESMIEFTTRSQLSNPDHPSRQIPESAEEIIEKAKEKDMKKNKEKKQQKEKKEEENKQEPNKEENEKKEEKPEVKK